MRIGKSHCFISYKRLEPFTKLATSYNCGALYTPVFSIPLCQCRLGLWEPEGHLHTSLPLRRYRQRGTGLLTLPSGLSVLESPTSWSTLRPLVSLVQWGGAVRGPAHLYATPSRHADAGDGHLLKEM